MLFAGLNKAGSTYHIDQSAGHQCWCRELPVRQPNTRASEEVSILNAACVAVTERLHQQSTRLPQTLQA